MTPSSATDLTVEDIDTIVEGIEEFIIGIDNDPELRAIWQPYIDKLNALKRQLGWVHYERQGGR